MRSGPEENDAFEKELLQVELRRPPAAWRASVLPPLPPVAVPWFPLPYVIGIGACWVAAGVLWLTTPAVEMPGPPLPFPADHPPMMPPDFLLGLNSMEETPAP